ncbi:MAG: hypothetical protein HY699_11980 [Deltaproteobacteria bacterium]|nr:hypothetical protein [Deltaproteobacteria bacterium]
MSVALWATASVAAATEPAGKSGAADWARSGLLGDFSLGSSRAPIRISADMLEFDYKRRVVVYRGGVEVTQGDLMLRSTTLTVRFDERAPEREKLKEIVAEGEVRIGKGTRFATGGRAVFDQAARTVVLSQDAVLHDGENRVAGQRVVVFLDEGRSVVEGGDERVHAVLAPPAHDDQSTGNSSGAERAK